SEHGQCRYNEEHNGEHIPHGLVLTDFHVHHGCTDMGFVCQKQAVIPFEKILQFGSNLLFISSGIQPDQQLIVWQGQGVVKSLSWHESKSEILWLREELGLIPCTINVFRVHDKTQDFFLNSDTTSLCLNHITHTNAVGLSKKTVQPYSIL